MIIKYGPIYKLKNQGHKIKYIGHESNFSIQLQKKSNIKG